MQRVLSLSIVVVLLAAYGVVEGWWTDRWSVVPALVEAQGRLSNLPLVVGPWRGEEVEMDFEGVVSRMETEVRRRAG